MKTLLFITNGVHGPGGLERVLSQRTEILTRAGYNVHILTINENDAEGFYAFPAAVHFHDIKVRSQTPNRFLDYFRGLQMTAAAVKPDVIFVCDDGLKGFFVPVLLGKKYVTFYERHASIFLNSGLTSHTNVGRRTQRILMRTLARTFDKFIVLSRSNIKEWSAKNIEVIGNPLPFYPEVCSSLTKRRVIAVGSHSFNKGYDLLLTAWTKVHAKHPDWTLAIFGRADSQHTFANMAADMGLSRTVEFYDPVRDIDQEYLDSSIMVLPSRSEGFGMVLIEAMASGLPTIAFDCPSGPRDIINHGKDGYLVSPFDIDGFAARIMELIESPAARNTLGAAARQAALRYAPDKIAAQWVELIESFK